MNGKCNVQDCAAPLGCHNGLDDCSLCENFVPDAGEKIVKKEKSTNPKKTSLSWTGEALSPNDASLITRRSSPIVIGIVGKADAGKTTFLAMFYTLLMNGRNLKDYAFAGSKTILGWDGLYHRLRLSKGGVLFPQPTPVNSNRLYHLALRDKEQQLRDVVFADASGEVFSLWSVNRNEENAENARWIYKNSGAFMLFIDCDALIKDLNAAKKDILRIARQMTHDLRNRPVIAVWSKSDKKNEILPSIKDTLKVELEQLFSNYTEIDISNFLEPGPDTLVHENNLSAVDWILKKVMEPSLSNLVLNEVDSDDLFIRYKGK